MNLAIVGTPDIVVGAFWTRCNGSSNGKKCPFDLFLSKHVENLGRVGRIRAIIADALIGNLLCL